MSTTVDNRVVQMTFNNKQFEKGVDQTLKTIDKLNKALKFEDASDGFENLQDAANSVDFKKLSDNVQSISDRFSGLGIIGAQIWTRIGNAAIDLVTGPFKKVEQTISGLTSKVENQIVQGGWNRALNLEKAEFMLKNLGQGWDTAKDAEGRYVEYTVNKDNKKVKNAYRAIAEAVDGTAFSLDEAASAAANFLASGVDAGEDLYNVLRSVQGMSSIFSTDFNQVAGYYQKIASSGAVTQGVVTYMTQTMGAPIAELLKESLNLTDAELTDALKDGLISFETFSDVMLEKFGDSLDEANNSYEGVVSNVKSALSRIGSAVTEPLIKRMIPTLNLLRLSINKVKNTLVDSGFYNFINDKIGKLFNLFDRILTPIADSDKEFTGLKNVITALVNIATGLGHIFDAFSVGYLRVFGKEGQKETKSLTERFLEFSKRFEEFFDASPDGHMHKLFTVFEAFFTVLKGAKTVLKAVLKVFTSLLSVFLKIAGTVAYLASRFILFISSLIETIKHSKTYNAILNVMQKCSEKLSNAFKNFVEKIKDIYNAFKDFIGENKFIKNACDTLKDAFKNLDEKVADVINNFTDLYDKFIEFGENSGLFDTIKNLWDGAVETVQNAVDNVVNKIEEWTGIDLGNPSLSAVTDAFKNFFTWIGEKFTEFKSDLVWVINNPKDALDELAESLSKIVESIPSTFDSVVSNVNSKFETFTSWITNFGKGMNDASTATDDFVKNSDKISGQESKFSFLDTLSKSLETLGKAFGFLIDVLKGAGMKILEGLHTAFEFFGDQLDIHTFSDFINFLMDTVKLIMQMNFAKAAGSIADFFNAFAFAGAGITKGGALLDKVPAAFLKLAAAIAIMGWTINLLAKIDTDTFNNVIDKMRDLIIILGVLLVLLKKVGVGTAKAKESTTLAISGPKGETSLAAAIPNSLIKSLGDTIQWVGLSVFLESLAVGILGVVAAVAGLAFAIKKLGAGPIIGAFAIIAILIAGMTAAILLIIKALKGGGGSPGLIEVLGKNGDVIDTSGGTPKITGALLGLAALMQAISIGIIELTAAMVVMSLMKPEKLANGFKYVALMLVVVAGVAALLIAAVLGLNKLFSSDASKGIAGVLAGIAALVGIITMAVLLLTPVIVALGLMDQDALEQGIKGISAIALIIGVIAALGMFSAKYGDLGEASAFILSIAAACLVIAIAIKALTQINAEGDGMDDAWQATGMLLLACFMCLLLAAIPRIAGQNADKGAALILSIAAAIGAFGIAIYAIANAGNIEAAWEAFGMIAAFVVLFVALGAVLGHFPIITAGLNGIGSAFLMFGAGVFLAAAGLAILIGIMKLVGDDMSGFTDKVESTVDLLVQVVVSFITGVVLGLCNGAVKIADALLKAFVAIVDWLSDHAAEIGTAVGRFFAVLVEIFIFAVAEFVRDVIDAFIRLFKSGFEISSPSKVMLRLGKFIIQGLLNGLKEVIKNVWKFIKSIPGKIIDFIFPDDKAEKIKEIGSNIIGFFIEGITSMISGVASAVSGVVGIVTGAFDSASDAAESALEKLTGKEKEFQEQQQRWADEAERAEQDRIATAKAFNESNGATAYEKLKKELDTAKELKKQYEQIKDNPLWSDSQKKKTLEEYNSAIKRLKTYEGQFARAFGEQYSEFQKTHDSNEWTNFKIFLDGQEKGAYKGWQYVADMIKKGLGDGLEGAEPITDWMTADYKEMLKFWDINSPSKLAGWVGKMIVYGLGNGITDNESYGLNALATFSEAACNVMENDLQPTITPVLDFASVQNGANQIGYIYSEGVKAAADLDIKSDAGRTAETLDNMSDLFNQIIFNTDSTGVEGKLDITAGLLTQLLTALSTQQLVLDTGAVVGGIAPAMDKELGMRSIRVGRRV